MEEWSQKVKDVFLDSQKESVIEVIHKTVKDGIYGADYTIAPRMKNKKLRKVCKFMKLYSLMPKWKEDADYEDVALYIKMVQPKIGQPIFIISFHESE